MKYKTGLIVGRFQPFHYGHLSMIRQGLEVSDKLKIIIGSANRNFELKNPLTLDERLNILKLVLKKEYLENSVELVSGLDDSDSDKEWMDDLINLGGDFQVIIGNDDLTLELAEDRDIEIFRPKLTKREIWQATIIRQNMMNGKKWKEWVPEYEIELLEKYRLEERLMRMSESDK